VDRAGLPSRRWQNIKHHHEFPMSAKLSVVNCKSRRQQQTRNNNPDNYGRGSDLCGRKVQIVMISMENV
jgi:hypothetical protein